jgi:ectoine hydroxylase-related dioxygenase (phytanoyl-CoA dioxygenase family)
MVEEEHKPELRPVCMKMRAGSCTFHDGLTFHYAPGNRTDASRRAMAIIYMPDGTTYRKKDHCVTDPLDLEDGARLDGKMFPLLAKGEAFATSTFKDARPMMRRLLSSVP